MTRPASADQPVERDPSEDVADWLKDIGRRGVHTSPKESDEALRVHLEHMAERKIRTRQDINDYVEDLARKAGDRRSRANQLKTAGLGILFAIALLQYYFIDVQLQILSQPAVTVFVPSSR
jgi:hypothetical protein